MHLHQNSSPNYLQGKQDNKCTKRNVSYMLRKRRFREVNAIYVKENFVGLKLPHFTLEFLGLYSLMFYYFRKGNHIYFNALLLPPQAHSDLNYSNNFFFVNIRNFTFTENLRLLLNKIHVVILYALLMTHAQTKNTHI